MMIAVEGAQEKGCFDRIGFVAVKQRRSKRQVGQIFHRRRRHCTLKCGKPRRFSSTGNDYDERGVKNRQRTTNTRCFMVMVPPFGNATTLPLPHQERDEGAEGRRATAQESGDGSDPCYVPFLLPGISTCDISHPFMMSCPESLGRQRASS